MAVTFNLDVVTPQKRVFSEEVTFATAPGEDGYFGVMPGHSPFLTTLIPGAVQIDDGPDPRFIVVSQGYAEVLGDRVTLLVDSAVRKEDIDAAAVKSDLNQLIRDLDNVDDRDPEWALINNRKKYAEAQLLLIEPKK
ncbi:MAG: ATP synthase F1 subunit epsilon [Magnetococcales bacterium]|nr:ATP synthase F1 subunit epsilon [Magnetococcales bacterium]